MPRVCGAAEIPVGANQWPLVVRRATTRDGKNLRFLFNFSGDSLSIRCPTTGLDLLSNGYFTAGSELGLLPWDAAVIREEF